MQFQELKATGNLPSPSGVALEILRLAQNENVKLDDVVHTISADPVLTGRVLKIANSSLYHQEQAVISIKKAIQKLGFGVLSRLALSLSTLDSNKSGKCEAFDYNQFWSKSLLRALAMQAINEHFKAVSADDAFTVGLIAEIGQLALAQIYPEEFSKCLTLSFEKISLNSLSKQRVTSPDYFDLLLEEERRLFLIDHHEITLAMLNDWHLPDLVINGIDLFQQGNVLDNTPHNSVDKLASQLYFASFLAGQSTLEPSLNGIERFRDALNIQESDLNILLKKLFNDWSDWKKFLNIQPVIQKPQRRIDDIEHEPLPRVLIIEDDRIQLHLLQNYYIQQGFETSTASNGEDALKLYFEFKPQIIITDNFMPTMDGMSFCKTLRATADGHFIYIILITADKSPDLMKQAFQAGVNDFIIKPLNHNELDARMLGALRFINLHKTNDLEHESIRNYAFKLASASRRLESLAFTDQLTGLPNRRFATTRLDLEWSKHIENGESFAIFSLDLDHFKQVNDNYGHDIGDKVLIHFAKTLQSVIRINDFAARMGGEEFVVIAPRIDEISVKMLGERIQTEVERNQPVALNLGRLITVSVGAAIADLSIDTDGWASTLKRSDQAVYAAKAAGRNTFKLHKNLQHRKHERIASKLEITIRNLSDQSDKQLKTSLSNFSQGGAFINHHTEWRPEKGQVLEVFIENQCKIAQVLRVTPIGYAVEFLNL